MRGGAVVPFYKEFLQLHSSSKPVPGFLSYITVPQTLPLQSTKRTAQNDTAEMMKSNSSCAKTGLQGNEDAQNGKIDTNVPLLSNPPSSEQQCSKDNIQPVCTVDTDVQTEEKPLPKPQPVAQQSASAANPQHSVYTHNGQTNVEPLGRNQCQVQDRQTPSNQTQRVEESNTSASHARRQPWALHQQPPFKTNVNVEQPTGATDAVFFQHRTRGRSIKPLETAAALNKQRQQWHYPLNGKSKVDFRPDQSHILTASQPQQQAKPGGRVLGTQTRRQDQPQKLLQQPTAEAKGSTATRALIPQLQPEPRCFSPSQGAKLLQPHNSQQTNPPPRLTWKPQGHAARARLVSRQTSFCSSYGAAQQARWRLGPSGTNTQLSRSKSMTDRHQAGYRGAGLHPNVQRELTGS